MSALFRIEPNDRPLPADQRTAALAAPKFGQVFSDHMLTMRYTESKGWHDGLIGPRGPLALDPACAALHYAQEIFEGMKVYRQHNGSLALFRPDANARRFAKSAQRMVMPELPESIFVEAVTGFAHHERAWVPEGIGMSLYLRPFMFASEAFLGVRTAREFIFAIIATPAGEYFARSSGLKLWVSTSQVRAVTGGTGAAKCGGNYAAGLMAQTEAYANGCDQVLFLDALEHCWIEELGSMNIFFVMADDSLITPPLSGTILPGITRDSILHLAGEFGMHVREEQYAFGQMQDDIASGAMRECFVCGTAAVVTSVGEILGENLALKFSEPIPGPITQRLSTAMLDLYYGRSADRFGWIMPIG